MNRLIRHLAMSPRTVAKHFSKESFATIESHIHESEQRHSGEICFAVEGALELKALLANRTPRERAIELFASQGVWNTERNNGVLLYLLLADRAIEIIADRGAERAIGPERWREIALSVKEKLQEHHSEAAVISGIDMIGEALAASFPPAHDDENELPNRPVRV